MKSVARFLRKIAAVQALDGLPDGQLLEAFLNSRDEAAFEALIRRHGPRVLGVCRRVLNNPQDSEDAFQACTATISFIASDNYKFDVSAQRRQHSFSPQTPSAVGEGCLRRKRMLGSYGDWLIVAGLRN
jgi:hypothetical protein